MSEKDDEQLGKDFRGVIMTDTASLRVDLFPELEGLTKEEYALIDDQETSAVTHRILRKAIEYGASDIHIERYARLVFRINGILMGVKTKKLFTDDTKSVLRAVVSRIRILSRITEIDIRKTQKGSFKFPVTDLKNRRTHLFQFRTTLIPVDRGQNLAIRVMDPQRYMRTLEDMGHHSGVVNFLQNIMDDSSGRLVVVCGPIGSGKTTTLYAVIRHLATGERKILTVENPIECEFDRQGLTQTSVDEAAGRRLEDLLEINLRSDTEKTVIGELLNDNTARLAIQTAQIGQHVLTTLHSFPAINAIKRLIGMGISRNEVAENLGGVVAQKLVQVPCEHCQAEYQPKKENILRVFGENPPNDIVFRRGIGCPRCLRTGSSDRIVLSEFLRVDDEIRESIERGDPIRTIEEIAIKNGMISIREDAIRKLRRGLVTIEGIVNLFPPLPKEE